MAAASLMQVICKTLLVWLPQSVFSYFNRLVVICRNNLYRLIKYICCHCSAFQKRAIKLYPKARRMRRSKASVGDTLPCYEYNRRFSLCRNAESICGFLRYNGDFQSGSEKPVSLIGTCGGVSGTWHSDLHGRTGRCLTMQR